MAHHVQCVQVGRERIIIFWLNEVLCIEGLGQCNNVVAQSNLVCSGGVPRIILLQ